MNASLIISADGSEVISLRQAAGIAGVALYSIQLAIIRGDMPCGRIANMHVVRLADAVAYKASKRAPNRHKAAKPAPIATSTVDDIIDYLDYEPDDAA